MSICIRLKEIFFRKGSPDFLRYYAHTWELREEIQNTVLSENTGFHLISRKNGLNFKSVCMIYNDNISLVCKHLNFKFSQYFYYFYFIVYSLIQAFFKAIVLSFFFFFYTTKPLFQFLWKAGFKSHNLEVIM